MINRNGTHSSKIALAAAMLHCVALIPGLRAQDDTDTPRMRGIKLKAAVSELSQMPVTLEPRFFMLAIGIDNYQFWDKLKTPVGDVKAVRQLLIDRYYFDPENTVELYDADATRENIINAFNTLRRKVTERDFLLVYYAGHGMQENFASFWIPVDGQLDRMSSWIPLDILHTQIKALKAKHALFICDSCFSGDMIFRGGVPNARDMSPNVRNAYHQISRAALTSGGSEPVVDSGVTREHSMFAYFLLRVLTDNNRQFMTPSGKNFMGYIRDGFELNTSITKQTPQYGLIPGSGTAKGEFVFMQKDGFFDPGIKLEALTYQEDEDLEEGDGAPKNTNSILFSNPGNAILRIGKQRYELRNNPTIYLGEGRYLFYLTLPGMPRIYGRLTVHLVNEDTEITPFGMMEGVFFKSSHIQAALEGRPVKYDVSVRTKSGLSNVISYVMSLQKMRK